MRLCALHAALAALMLAACGGAQAPTPREAEYGLSPNLVEPNRQIIPTTRVPEAVGWPADAAPQAPEGFAVSRFADGLDHPRWAYVLPNGDVLIAQASTIAREGGGIAGWVENSMMRRAGALGDGPGQIVWMRDADGDGVAEERAVFASDLYQPFGMALVGDRLYVAETNALVRFPYEEGARSATAAPEHVLDLPYHAPRNGHWTRDLQLSDDGATLFVSVGSVTNIADNGMEIEEGRAAIWAVDPVTGAHEIFASGLRNPVGLDINPATGALWTAVNERDMLGDALVPDYITSVQEGAFYGWPYSYFGQNVDSRVRPQNPDLVASAIAPDLAVGAHTASLGLEFYTAEAFPARFRGGAFIGQHGSWNRSSPVGYKVAFAPFENGAPTGEIEDFLTGFLSEDVKAQGRPVGVATAADGALLVVDDVGGVVWRVAYEGASEGG